MIYFLVFVMTELAIASNLTPNLIYSSFGLMNFTNCEKTCASLLDGRMPCLTSSEDNQELYDLILSRPPENEGLDAVWLGFTDMVNEGSFVWNEGCDSSYTNWASGEPNDSGGAEDCAAMADASYNRGGWNDIGCERLFPCACQWDNSSFPTVEPTPAPYVLSKGVFECDSSDHDLHIYPDTRIKKSVTSSMSCTLYQECQIGTNSLLWKKTNVNDEHIGGFFPFAFRGVFDIKYKVSGECGQPILMVYGDTTVRMKLGGKEKISGITVPEGSGDHFSIINEGQCNLDVEVVVKQDNLVDICNIYPGWKV